MVTGAAMSSAKQAAEGSVLVVDDNLDFCSFMRTALTEAGYRVRVASKGEHALAMLHERAADLLITDIFMPGMDGYDTISRCKAEFPGTRFIAMSAGGGSSISYDVFAAAEALGAGATLRKPFTAVELTDAVHRVLQPA